MLARVAERIYWTARYLERVENTARLVSVYDNLLFDLPRDTHISWYNLIVINSSTESFHERYKVKDERNVVKFLLADDTNYSSLLSSLRMVRENLRTTRDVVPQETWELINELMLYASNNIKQGINRSQRHAFLNTIIKGCQEINGLLSGTMSRDAGWQFVMMGRNVERADMTTRILDAGASANLQSVGEDDVDISQVIWGNVLRSLSADLNYRRAVRSSVSASKVARYLLEDRHFPRTVAYCLNEIRTAAAKLPNAEPVIELVEKASATQYNVSRPEDISEAFRDYLNDLQITICMLSNTVSENWFAFKQEQTA